MKEACTRIAIGIGFALALSAYGCNGGGGGSSSTVPGAGVGNSFTLASVKWGRLVDVYDKNNAFFGKQIVNPSLTTGPQYTLSTNALSGHTDLKVLNFAQTDAGFQGILNSASNQLSSTVIKGPTDTYGFSMIPRNAGIKLQFTKEIDPPTLNPNTVKIKAGSPPTIPFDVGTLSLDPLDHSAVFVSAVVLAPENIALGINLNPTGFPASSNNVDPTLRVSFPYVVTPFTGQNEILRDVDGKPMIPASNPVDATNNEIARLFRTGGSFDTNAGFLSDSESPRIVGSQTVTMGAPSLVSGTQYQLAFTFDVSFCTPLRPKAGDILVQNASYGTLVQILDGVSATKTVIVDMVSGVFNAGSGTLKTFYDDSDTNILGYEPCFVNIAPAPTITGSQGNYGIVLDENSVFTVEFSEPVNGATVLPFRTLTVTNRDDGILDITKAPVSSGALVGYKWSDFVVASINAAADLKSFQLTPILPLSKNTLALNPRIYDLHVVKSVQGLAVGVKDFAGNDLDLSNHFELRGMTIASSSFQTESRTFRFKGSNMNESGDTSASPTSVATAAAGGVSHCQFSSDPDGGVTGRSAVPYSRIVDDTQTFVKLMNVTQGGLQTPLVPLGAKMKTLWRYHDVFGGQIPAGQGGGAGPSVTDKETWHVSVVGLNWSPFGGNVFPDSFGRFKLLLGHSLYAPIARVDVNNTTGPWANTGFNNTATLGKNQFKNNALETANFDIGTTGSLNAGKAGMNQPELTTVFDGNYQIQPAALFNAGTHKFIPYPTFQNFFVWRNLTYVESSGVNLGIPFIGGGTAGGEGADSLEFQKAQLTPNVVWRYNTGWPSRSLPSIALPLVLEYRCFPNAETGVNALGLNGFATSFMFNTNQNGTPNPGPLFDVLPCSRMFSQGYTNASTGAVNTVSPESSASNAIVPSGGWCPVNCAPTGTSPATPTSGFDPTIYWGVVNLQNIESVFFSSWVDTGDTSTNFGGFVIEPAKPDLPPGTDIVVEFRGCNVPAGGSSPQVSAARLDPYGNCDGGIPGTGGFTSNCTYPCNPTSCAGTTPGGVQPVNGTTLNYGLTAWTTNIASLSGKKWFQMRVRLVANPVTNIVPTLKGVGVAWY